MAHSEITAPAERPPIASAAVFVGTLVGLILLVGVLLSLDLLLAGAERRGAAAHAASAYDAGVALLRRGKPRDAIEEFATAVAIERRNVQYSLGLAEAMLESGRVEDAESTLHTLLESAQNDGAVNLVMARTMVRRGRAADAKAYFHRAIYGRWGADSAMRRTQARFELIDFLERAGDGRELLAELLPFEDTPAESVALRRRLGTLFIAAGSPARGANMFREVLRRDPDDPVAYAGMGEAALALGNFRTARADFARAASLAPDDAAVAARLALADTILALDPGARGLTRAERQTRARVLLERTIATLHQCAPAGATPAMAAATQALAAPVRVDDEGAVDAFVDAAAALWDTRRTMCPALHDEALQRLLAPVGR